MAKIPIILEPGRADGKLATSSAIFDENKGMFQSEINDIQDTLNSNNPNKPLSANQGKILKELLDAKVIEAGDVPIDTEPIEGNITHIVNSDGLAKKFNKHNTEIILGSVYDISSHNDGAVFESLQALLSNTNLNTLIPTSVRHGGMSIRFVQSSDNKYVQYRLMATAWSNIISDWQGVDDEPTTGSNNLVNSGGVAEKLSELKSEINGESKKTITPIQGSNFVAEIDVNEGDTINISAIASIPLTVSSYIILYMNEERIYRSSFIISSNTQGSIPPFNVTIAGKVVIKFEYNEYTQNTIDFIISPAKKGAFDLINDLADSLANTKTSIGELSDLETENKDSIVSSINEINAICGKTTRHLTDEEIISGSYRVIPNGELAKHNAYSYTRPIKVYSGDTIKLIGVVITSVCAITKVDADNNPIMVLLVGQGNNVSEYEYIVESDGYISISCLSSIISTVTISHLNLPKYKLPIDNIDRLWKITENPLECIKRESGYGAIIREWGFIGDSYSSGETPAKDSSGVLVTSMDIYPISWGQQFVRLIGAKGYNFSNGGQTAKGWLRSQGTKHDSSYIGGVGGGDWRHAQLDKKQAYFISLGINDNGYINKWEQEGKQYLGDSYTLGDVETDIDLDNYTNNNENTFVGCYAGIIQRLLSIQPKAKIFVVTQFQPTLDHINNAIRLIASKFNNNVFIVDLRMYAPNITDNMQYYMKNGHPTPYGYMYMAYLINTYVDWIIRNNKDKFMDVTLIGTDYTL